VLGGAVDQNAIEPVGGLGDAVDAEKALCAIERTLVHRDDQAASQYGADRQREADRARLTTKGDQRQQDDE
jgi:hypothetical protein